MTCNFSLECWALRSGSCLYELWHCFPIHLIIMFRFDVCIIDGILCVCFKIVSCLGLSFGASVVLSWLILIYLYLREFRVFICVCFDTLWHIGHSFKGGRLLTA